MQNWVSALLDESFLTKRNFTKGLIIVGPGWIALAPFWQISEVFRFFPLVPPMKQ